jgi:arylsulfatase A-like enzyme
MSISFKAPHMPFTPDSIDMKLYEGKTFTRAANYGVENGKHLSPQVHTSRAATSYREWVTDYDNVAAKYYALITGMDAAVGMIIEELERQGLANNTVIIFTSDNGYNSGSHGFGDKVIPYEEGSKSPLIIYDPRLSKEYGSKICNAITGNVDMAATILALSGVPAPADIDGKNLLSLLTNPQGNVREYLPLFNFWGIESAQSMAVVTPEWKYIYWYYAGDGMKPVEELFHLTQDRIEMHQLAADPQYATQLKMMHKFYDTQLDHLSKHVYQGHDYVKFPTLFSRTIPQEQKTPLLEAATKARQARSKAGEN